MRFSLIDMIACDHPYKTNDTGNTGLQEEKNGMLFLEVSEFPLDNWTHSPPIRPHAMFMHVCASTNLTLMNYCFNNEFKKVSNCIWNGIIVNVCVPLNLCGNALKFWSAGAKVCTLSVKWGFCVASEKSFPETTLFDEGFLLAQLTNSNGNFFFLVSSRMVFYLGFSCEKGFAWRVPTLFFLFLAEKKNRWKRRQKRMNWPKLDLILNWMKVEKKCCDSLLIGFSHL